VTASDLKRQIDARTAPVVIDVRSRHEFAAGHVPGALHVPFWQMRRQIENVSTFKDHPVVLYCGHGPRAYLAGRVLRRHGFKHVTYLEGHMKRWRELNFPIEV
jgi:rhodanese-related sulfurtransferase